MVVSASRRTPSAAPAASRHEFGNFVKNSALSLHGKILSAPYIGRLQRGATGAENRVIGTQERIRDYTRL